MNVCVLYYDGFCESEIVLSIWGRPWNVFSAALENRVYVSEEKQKYLPDRTIAEVAPDEVDLLLIPGGNPAELYDNSELRDFFVAVNSRHKLIAGICAGPFLMAKYGVLDGKRCTGGWTGIEERHMPLFAKAHVLQDDVVVDGNTVTAKGQAFTDFAVAVGRVVGVYQSEDEAQAELRFLKNLGSNLPI